MFLFIKIFENYLCSKKKNLLLTGKALHVYSGLLSKFNVKYIKILKNNKIANV